MSLNPATVLNPVLNFLDGPDLELRCFFYLVFVWLSLAAIAWVLGGGLRRKRLQGRPARVNSGVIDTTRPPNQSPPPTATTEIDPVQNDATK
jgi:hypothetical protein